MHRMLIGLLVWLVAHSPARAWNATGHKLIASIAFRQLKPDEQSAVVTILERHPRYAEDFAEQMPSEVRDDDQTRSEWLFQQAATWPDSIRSGPPAKRALNRSEWHYVNLPVFLDNSARSEQEGLAGVNTALDPPADATTSTSRMNIVQVIRFARGQLVDKHASPEDRAVLLAWLFHNVGDVHQPLHSSALYSSVLFPQGDRGGNSIKTRQTGNLHSLWDQFPSRNDTYHRAHNLALTYSEDPTFVQLGMGSAESLDESVWLDESHELAKAAAYNGELLTALRHMETTGGPVAEIDLTQEYLKEGGRIAERRLVQAGYRLAAVLRTIVAQ